MTKLDKRTKEYKKWKKNFENKSKGLGDDVEKVFKKTGIAKVAKWALGEDCGCDQRKEKLNKLFPSQKPECLNENEYNYLSDKIGKINTVTIDEQKQLLNIYNRVFNDKVTLTSCSTCFLNGVYKKLETLLLQY